MSDTFHGIHFNVAGESDSAVESAGARPLALRAGPSRTTAPSFFTDEEAAARFYLGNILKRDTRPTVRGLSAPDRPEVVPDLKLRDSQRSPLTNTSVVRFVQTKSAIPIFGSRAIVELDDKRELLGVDAELAQVEGVSPFAQISPQQVLEGIASEAGVKVEMLGKVDAPELTFFHDDANKSWHLAYYARNISVAPANFFDGLKSHSVGRSLAERQPQLDYLVDAHTGKVLLFWSSNPTAIAKCEGLDEDGVKRIIYANVNSEGGFELSDSLRRIRTIDFGGEDIETATPPEAPIKSTGRDFAGLHAAVSAHFNAARVMDFLRSILMRDGVDGKGMELISYINCTAPAE